MPLLRYLYVLALAAWVGGLLLAGAVVAPAVFAVVEGASGAGGRVLAGQVFGEVLRRTHLVGYLCGGVMLAALTLHRLLGSRPVGVGVRASIAGAMLAGTLVSGLVVSPRVAALQRDAGGAVASLAGDDPRRAEFFRWHGYSNLLLAVVAAGGLVLLGWEARE